MFVVRLLLGYRGARGSVPGLGAPLAGPAGLQGGSSRFGGRAERLCPQAAEELNIYETPERPSTPSRAQPGAGAALPGLLQPGRPGGRGQGRSRCPGPGGSSGAMPGEAGAEAAATGRSARCFVRAGSGAPRPWVSGHALSVRTAPLRDGRGAAPAPTAPLVFPAQAECQVYHYLSLTGE